jgi:hypothetical protein
MYFTVLAIPWILFYPNLLALTLAKSSPAKAGGFKPGTWKIN